MSYKCLLFCPDERTARLVTQVLSELEFTVTLSTEPSATVKKLADEHFDALVVDIQNEQDAALLFKSARNSSLNHSSLAVAVVEGQAGVAKSFRIGANLVLTKPINIEQSKSTLRVARGLLRKNEAKPTAASATAPATPPTSPYSASPAGSSPKLASASSSVPAPVISEAFSAGTIAVPAAAALVAGFSLLETEKEQTPAPEPTEIAYLESMSDPVAVKPSADETARVSGIVSSAVPIAASTTGAATAAAPARSKPSTEIKFSAPLATQDAIVADSPASEAFEAASAPVPTFSTSLGEKSGVSGTARIFAKIAVLLVIVAAGYGAWQRFQLGQYLSGTHSAQQSSPQSVKDPAVIGGSKPTSPASVSASPAPIFDDSANAGATGSSSTAASASSLPAATSHKSQQETIRVAEIPEAPEPKVTVVSKPLVVKPNSGGQTAQSLVQPPPPSLALPLSTANSALANLASASPVPMLAPHTLRISQGVSQGLLVKKVPPVYPSVALQLHKQGPVELIATVSKDGSIRSVKPVSGDAMLAAAAADAVRQWKYRPYLLSGEPVEIETQITVNFRLPN